LLATGPADRTLAECSPAPSAWASFPQSFFQPAGRLAESFGLFRLASGSQVVGSFLHLPDAVPGAFSELLPDPLTLGQELPEFPFQLLGLVGSIVSSILLALLPQFTSFSVQVADSLAQLLSSAEVLPGPLGELLQPLGLLSKPLSLLRPALSLELLGPLAQ